MPSSIARLSRLDHERLLRLLRRMCIAGPNQDRWRHEFVALLTAHRAAERDELLGQLADLEGEFANAARHQDDADRDLDRLAVEVEAADIAAAEWDQLCDRAESALAGHAQRMTDQVLLPLEEAAERKEMRRLGGRYEQSRDAHLREAGMAEQTPRRLDLPRAELYELARRAGIEGRSAMSRGELIAELQRRELG